MDLSPEELAWLTGPDAAAALRWLQQEDIASLGAAQRLRREYSADRARLLLTQAELRQRAQVKFRLASSMFFTPLGLEQATDEVVAEYKSQRYPTGVVVDLCCGIGGDAMALALHSDVLAVDLSPVCTRFAAINGQVAGRRVEAECRDAAHMDVSCAAAWHIDPDRRAQGRRTSRVLHSSPTVEAIDGLLRQCQNAAIKLAPAAVAPPQWSDGEREWISRDGECKQQVAWLGNLAWHAGRRSATILRGVGRRTVVASENPSLPPAAAIGRYLYEPDAAVLSARLVSTLTMAHGLECVDASSNYLTGDVVAADLALSSFLVLDVLPLDRRQLRPWLRQRKVGRLEIKKRGIELDVEQLRRELPCSGDEEATLIATKFQRRHVAVMCRRP